MGIGLMESAGVICLSLFLGWLIGLTYARAYRGILLSASFVHTTVIAVPLVALSILAIRNTSAASPSGGQALAFSFVGLLGLIRFRTVIRDTREFTFVFLAIVTGVGVGSGLFIEAASVCCLLLFVLLVLEFTGFGTAAPSLQARITSSLDALPTYQSALERMSSRVELEGIVCEDNLATYKFDVVARPGESLPTISAALKSIPGTTNVEVVRLRRAAAK
jgi:hypothetical protein